jgi:hypothetical protein
MAAWLMPSFHGGTGQRGSRPMLLALLPNEFPLDHPVMVTTSGPDTSSP